MPAELSGVMFSASAFENKRKEGNWEGFKVGGGCNLGRTYPADETIVRVMPCQSSPFPGTFLTLPNSKSKSLEFQPSQLLLLLLP